MPLMVAAIQEQTYSLTIDEDTPRKVILDGQEQVLDWKQITSLARDERKHGNVGGCYSLILGGRSYQVFARCIPHADEKNGQRYEISIDEQRFEVVVEDERTRALAGLIKESAHSAEAIMYAPMPGLVVDILHEPGAIVKAGQPIIILEAMKMENDLSSPIQGKIKKISVNKGQTVDLGAALVVIDGNVEG